MPDIAMCNADGCPKAARCKRNPASGTKPDAFWQSWFAPAQWPCDHFWPVNEPTAIGART